LDVGHELWKVLLILRQLVDAARRGIDHDRTLHIRHRVSLMRTLELAKLFVRRSDAGTQRGKRGVDLGRSDDERRLETNDALGVERPCGGNAVLEHLRNNPAAVSLVAQFETDEQTQTARFPYHVRVLAGDGASAVQQLF